MTAASEVFGQDATKAPDWEAILAKAGVPDGRIKDVLGLLGSLAEPGAPFLAAAGTTKKAGKTAEIVDFLKALGKRGAGKPKLGEQTGKIIGAAEDFPKNAKAHVQNLKVSKGLEALHSGSWRDLPFEDRVPLVAEMRKAGIQEGALNVLSNWAGKTGIKFELNPATGMVTIDGKPMKIQAATDYMVGQHHANRLANLEAEQAAKPKADVVDLVQKIKAKPKGLDMSKEARLERAKEQGFDTNRTWYHGTNRDFSEFKQGHDGLIHVGTPDQANERIKDRWSTDGEAPRNIPVFVKGKNFLRTEDLGSFGGSEMLREAEKQGAKFPFEKMREYDELYDLSNKFTYGSKRDYYRESQDLRNQMLKDAGYDGVIYKNTGEVPPFLQDQMDKLSLELGRDTAKAVEMMGSPDPVIQARGSQLRDATGNASLDAEALRKLSVPDSIAVFEPNQLRSPHAKFDPKNSNSGNILAGIAGAGLFPLLMKMKETREEK